MHPLGFQRIYFELRVSLLLWGEKHYAGLKEAALCYLLLKNLLMLNLFFFPYY